VNTRTLATTAVAPALWGTTYAVTAELLPTGRPLLAATLRALPIGVAFTVVGRRLPQGRWWYRAALLGLCNFGAFFALLFTAAYRLPGGLAATIGAVQPMIVIALIAVVLAERPTARRMAAAGLGFVGVALLVLRSSIALDPVGVAAAFGAAASMATGTVLVQRWGRPAPLLTFAGWQLAAGGLLLAPLTLVTEGVPDVITAENVGGYAYLTLLGAGVAYPLWFRGIERLGAGAATFLSLLSPVMATIVGVGFRGERMSWAQGVGVLAVLTSVLLANSAPSAKPKPAPCPPVRSAPPLTAAKA
jgi:probable blue pigment (indigoidine) exporter